MKTIPVDQLQHKTSTGLEIKVFKSEQRQAEPDTLGAHRDDHYIFFLLTAGSGSLIVDLEDIVVATGQLFYITPSQVHHRIRTDGAQGWFLAVDPSLIPAEFRKVFEHRGSLQLPCTLSNHELKQYSTLLDLLNEEFRLRQQDTFYLPVIHSLLHSFLGMAASNYNIVHTTVDQHARPAELTDQFKRLLTTPGPFLKTASAYASVLNVSVGYLNESIKKTTGSTVTYWIQQEIFNEAKRLLLHSDADVKQIAVELGYTDYSYFSRSFRKVSGMSPSKFRLFSRNL